jgi:predicted patatin/cPLA2 family phospholipase
MTLHPTACALLDRQVSASQPGLREDDRIIALAIEGGGMRGVVAAGMVTALERLGLRDCFDSVYGSSAGSISGAYFIAAQAGYGASIFYNHINNRKFIDLKRILRGRPIISLEFLLDEVCIRDRRLDYDRVLKSAISFKALQGIEWAVLPDHSGGSMQVRTLRRRYSWSRRP